MIMVFEVLNRLRWKGGLERCQIIILHRGAPGDRKTIHGKQVTGLDRHYFYCRDESGRETMIPLHRILEVRLEKERDGLDKLTQAVRLEKETLWKRKEKPEKSD